MWVQEVFRPPKPRKTEMLGSLQRTSGSAQVICVLASPCAIDSFRTVMLRRLAVAIVIFNLADAISTLIWVHLDLATEANPLLAPYVLADPVNFVLCKILLVSLSVTLLLRLSGRPIVPFAMTMAASGYAAICVYHGWFAANLAGFLA